MIIAGHNGAGKSTCYREYLADVFKEAVSEHIDPDQVEKEIRSDWKGARLSGDEFSRMAQAEAKERRAILLENGESFSFETVFSDPVGEKVRFIQEAKEKGYVVALLGVGLDSAEISKARVALRVQRGGHDVPPDRLENRYDRVLINFAKGAKVATVALLVDNSIENLDGNGGGYTPVALCVSGKVVDVCDEPPSWWHRVTQEQVS
jgi:predicted ABC-type ATPase